jgi:3,4-dihydroxy 2-butanone 4-phosphate synthase/GTP cyclohydrolase II
VDTFKIFGIDKVELLTNNPKKFDFLLKNGIEVVQKQISIQATEHNMSYLLAKKNSMGHELLDP